MTAKRPRAKRPRKKYELEVAPDVQERLQDIVALLPDRFGHVDARRIVCFRSRGATARIYARIWALPRIFQIALGVEPHYAVEVVEAFDRQSVPDQDRTLVHELMHVPKTFSGALVPHKCFGKDIDCRSVEVVYRELEARRRAAAVALPAEPAAPRGASDIAPTFMAFDRTRAGL